MKTVTILLLYWLPILIAAQTPVPKNTNKGFMFGLGIGGGQLSLTKQDTLYNKFATTLPNIKVGYRFNSKIAVLALLPGANYKYLGKSRGFEGFVLAAQYWPKDKWWLFAGCGLTFDAPAFYTVKDPKTAGFYTGAPALSFATGYQIRKIKKCTIDVQYRFFYGQSNLPNSIVRKGYSNMLILGFNWQL